MLPDRWMLLGGALLAAGALVALGILLLPRSHRLRCGLFPLLPQLIATAGASAAVWGWFVARRVVNQWKIEDMPPLPDLKQSVERVIDWKDRFGLLLPALLLLGLLLSALPIWRSGKENH